MSEEKCFVLFVCQSCSQSLRLDKSLNSFSEHVSAELNLPVHSNPDVDLESQATSFDHYVPPCRLSDSGNGENGFMLISDEDEVDLLSHQYKVQVALFDTMSGNSNIDHPVCDECADNLTELMEQQVKTTIEDHNDYSNYFKILQNQEEVQKLCELNKILKDSLAEEERLLEEIKAMDKVIHESTKETEEQTAASEIIRLQEEKYFKAYTKLRREVVTVEEEKRSMECNVFYANSELEKLHKTNVFNATFHIWHKGHFGTINNFRLGRLPSAPVDWSEINAAWGQTSLLLFSLARKLNLLFDKFKLIPCGNHSYIEVLGDQKELPLYGSGGFRYYWDTKFDSGMVAFLECLQQFQEKVEKLEKANSVFCFPYRTNKGKIEDKDASYSIKIQLNSEEQWTKALKFMLTNLKWGLAWVSSQFDSDGVEIEVPNVE